MCTCIYVVVCFLILTPLMAWQFLYGRVLSWVVNCCVPCRFPYLGCHSLWQYCPVACDGNCVERRTVSLLTVVMSFFSSSFSSSFLLFFSGWGQASVVLMRVMFSFYNFLWCRPNFKLAYSKAFNLTLELEAIQLYACLRALFRAAAERSLLLDNRADDSALTGFSDTSMRSEANASLYDESGVFKVQRKITHEVYLHFEPRPCVYPPQYRSGAFCTTPLWSPLQSKYHPMQKY